MKKNAKKKPPRKQPHTSVRSRDALVAHLRPLVEGFVEGLVDIAWNQVSSKLDRAMEAAMASLSDDELPAEPSPEPEPEPAPVRDAMGDTYTSPITVTIEQAASPPRVRACSACGKPGHRRPTCPGLNTVAPVIAVEEDDEADEEDRELPSAPLRPALDRAQRFAAIEQAAARREAAAR